MKLLDMPGFGRLRGLLGRASVAVSLLLVACGTATFVVQQYEGEARDPSEIATLRVNGGTDVAVVALDGEEIDYVQSDENSRVHIELLPGIHEVDVGNVADPLRRVVRREFLARPGEVYRITIDAPAGGLREWRPLLWVVDRDSDRALRVVVNPARTAQVGSTAASAAPEAPAASAAPEALPSPSDTAPSSAAPSAGVSSAAPSAGVSSAAPASSSPAQ